MSIVTNSREALTGEEIQWAYQKWCEGRPQHQIAKALHVSQTTLCQTFIRHGLKRQLIPLRYERRKDND